jgi:hypothetical protein
MVEDGLTYETGFRIAGQHCGGCGRPDSTRPRYVGGLEVVVGTPCCSRLRCFGDVTTTPWLGTQTSRLVWACCRGLAERHLGEPASLILLSDEDREATRG